MCYSSLSCHETLANENININSYWLHLGREVSFWKSFEHYIFFYFHNWCFCGAIDAVKVIPNPDICSDLSIKWNDFKNFSFDVLNTTLVDHSRETKLGHVMICVLTSPFGTLKEGKNKFLLVLAGDWKYLPVKKFVSLKKYHPKFWVWARLKTYFHRKDFQKNPIEEEPQ